MPGPLSDPGNGSMNKMKSLLLSMPVSLNSEQVCKKSLESLWQEEEWETGNLGTLP